MAEVVPGPSLQARPDGAALLSKDHVELSPQQWGMLSFLLSEVAFFTTLIVVYLSLAKSEQTGPTPAVLSLPLVIGTTICLLSSSVTIHFADGMYRKKRYGDFFALWLVTIILGVVFLAGTAYEWNDLIRREGLTISRNLFGTCYYTLVGFHGLHVTVGVIAMICVLALAKKNRAPDRHGTDIELVSWYWHFVDAVWIVVFTVVYLMR
jgi:cytochrome c oxidase subunit 3/cytochrome o ubiquinol oxidase subunit 3